MTTNAQAALIAAASQASRGNAMGITPLLEKAGAMLAWLEAKDAEERGKTIGAYVPQPQEPHEIKAQPVTVCDHYSGKLQPNGQVLTCLLAGGHLGVHRATVGGTKFEWTDHKHKGWGK